ncbi:MAG: hypothetical protein EZS28_013886 [Streblomastix strix]|uniref:Uncharacterized protein n=1 Tax=Streblomastix strix TaxID=222440 RepID=A0A5J4W880_9EUKA|nr:MAG: hypothetical protein EZS28_013886 [Streblomastix strix]
MVSAGREHIIHKGNPDGMVVFHNTKSSSESELIIYMPIANIYGASNVVVAYRGEVRTDFSTFEFYNLVNKIRREQIRMRDAKAFRNRTYE